MALISQLPPQSRLWVYAADRQLREEEGIAIQSELDNFVSNWSAHDMPLQGAAEIQYHRLVVLAVNETFQGISGCGIDKSVKLMKELGARFQIDFFNRMQILVKKDHQLVAYNKLSLQNALQEGHLHENAEVFNPLVQNLGDFREKAFVSLKDFWMAPQLKFQAHL